MGFLILYFFLIFVGFHCFHFSKAKEHMCSKFENDEQLLEKMIRTEIKVETIADEIKKTQDNVLNSLRDIKQGVADFSDKFVALRENIMEKAQTKGDQIRHREELFKKLFEENKANMTRDVDDQRNTIVQLQEKLERPSIAFYAHHVTDKLPDTNDEVIIFDKTITNEGTGYNTTTGIFTAPIGGLYQFVVHICTYYNKYTHIGLTLEGRIIAGNLNYDKDYYTCSSFVAIEKVRSGEKVWVKSTSQRSGQRLYESGVTWNTFGGMLVNI